MFIHQSPMRALAPLCCAMAVIAAAPARADFVQLPAVAFAVRSASEIVGDAAFGTLTNAKGTFFAAVPFAKSGEQVCAFTLVHRDNDGDFGITAKLMKKKIVKDANPFDVPTEMARVDTGEAAATAGVQKLTSTAIVGRKINLKKGFYFVELVLPATTLEVLGIQIDVRATC